MYDIKIQSGLIRNGGSTIPHSPKRNIKMTNKMMDNWTNLPFQIFADLHHWAWDVACLWLQSISYGSKGYHILLSIYSLVD